MWNIHNSFNFLIFITFLVWGGGGGGGGGGEISLERENSRAPPPFVWNPEHNWKLVHMYVILYLTFVYLCSLCGQLHPIVH